MNKTMSRIASAVKERKAFSLNAHDARPMYAVNVRDNGNLEVLYRGTMVALVMPDRNRVFFNTGGWLTVTTKRILNAVLEGIGANAAIFQDNWNWCIRRWDAETFDTLNVCLFSNFDRFALPLAINGRGTLTESEKLFNA